MKKRLLVLTCLMSFCLLFSGYQGNACTNLLVTKGASDDGSVMITYTCDGEFHPILEYYPASDYGPNDSLEITDWSGKVRGKVKQVPHTYAVVGLMNEYQLTIGETTFDGREELRNPDGLLHYWDMMQLALERAKTAREAIKVMADLVDEYGYRSTGETFSIADPKEAWIMEMIGPDSGGAGAEWVALRIPDGYISCHANKARIGEFPLKDKKNCLYSPNVISFAIEKGLRSRIRSAIPFLRRILPRHAEESTLCRYPGVEHLPARRTVSGFFSGLPPGSGGCKTISSLDQTGQKTLPCRCILSDEGPLRGNPI
jgi:dipeptidase